MQVDNSSAILAIVLLCSNDAVMTSYCDPHFVSSIGR